MAGADVCNGWWQRVGALAGGRSAGELLLQGPGQGVESCAGGASWPLDWLCLARPNLATGAAGGAGAPADGGPVLLSM